MIETYLLDTDICSYSIKARDPHLQARITHAPPGSLAISVVTQAELLYGIKKYPSPHPRSEEVLWFLNLARIVDWDSSAAEAYADIRHSLTSSGRLIGELDMMIAAQAIAHGYILVSNNTAHFQRIVPPLQLQNWTQQ